jgi:hypothetical protein
MGQTLTGFLVLLAAIWTTIDFHRFRADNGDAGLR